MSRYSYTVDIDSNIILFIDLYELKLFINELMNQLGTCSRNTIYEILF